MTHIQRIYLLIAKNNLIVSPLALLRVLKDSKNTHLYVRQSEGSRVVHNCENNIKVFSHEDLAEVATVAEHLITANVVVGYIVRMETPVLLALLFGELVVGTSLIRLKENRIVKLGEFMFEFRPAQSLDIELYQLVKT